MRRGNIVKEIAAKMKEIAPWAKTILYGSEARGDARPDSDIDLLIIIPDKYDKEYLDIRCRIIEELYDIEIENDVVISPLILLHRVWNSRKTPFTVNVNNEGKIL